MQFSDSQIALFSVSVASALLASQKGSHFSDQSGMVYLASEINLKPYTYCRIIHSKSRVE